MRLQLGCLCDYACHGGNGKLTLVGIWDTLSVQTRDADGSIAVVPFSLALVIMGTNSEVGNHNVDLRILNADAEQLGVLTLTGVPFKVVDPEHGLRWQFAHQFFGMKLPDLGDYVFEIRIDGETIGEVPFHLTQSTFQQTTPQ